MNEADLTTKPKSVVDVLGEVRPQDGSSWEPNNFAEWEARERLQAYLRVWSQQTDDERKMRSLYAKMIFSLICVEVAFAFLLMVLIGAEVLHFDVTLLKVLFPSVLAQVFGLGYLVTRYLFGKQLTLPISEITQRKKSSRTS
jgi:archaellum biogenesis protein FlaJ (TadC family)